jgi:hypothetical protein
LKGEGECLGGVTVTLFAVLLRRGGDLLGEWTLERKKKVERQDV